MAAAATSSLGGASLLVAAQTQQLVAPETQQHKHMRSRAAGRTQALVAAHADKRMTSYAPVSCYRCARGHVVKQLMCGGR